MKVSRAHIAVLSLIQVSLSFTTTVYPQSGFRFQHYTTADGIPTNFVSQVVQDGQGYLWFKHQFELSRFNGYNFKVYKNNPDDSLLNLGQNLLGSLTIDQSGDLWINSLQDSWQSGSLFKYDRKTDGFIQYKPDLKGAFINSMAFDRRQPVVWLAGRFGRGLFSFNLETYETKSFVDSPIDSLTLKFIGNMQDCGSFLLLGSRQGLRTFDKATKAFGRPKCNSKDSTILLSSPIGVANHDEHNNHWMYKPAYKPDDRTTFLRVDSIYSITQRFELPKGFAFTSYFIDKEDIFWFTTTENGLCRYDPGSGSIIYAKNIPGDLFSLRSNDLRDVTVDSDLNVWVATNRGISKLQNKSVKFYSSYVVSQQAGCNEFRSLNATDKEYILGLGGDNTLWIAEFSLRDSLNFVQFNFEEPNVPWSNFISSWIGKHHFWIATWGRGVIGLPINQTTKMIEHGPAKYLSHDPKNTNTLSTNETWSIYEDEEETLWVGTFSGLNMVNPNLRYGEKGSVTRYNHDPQDSSSISHDIVRQILPQDERSLWVATEVGVDLFEKQKGKFEHPFKNRETVSVIHKSKDGTMFVGTQGGLYETRKKQGQITFTKSPIFSESITYLAEDQLGRLWYASYNGIVCFDRKRQIAIRINERDGLHDSEGNLFQIENGVLVYSNGESIAAFDPKSLVTSEKQIVPVLTNVSVNNSEPVLGNRLTGIDAFRLAGHVSTIDELELDYQHNNFSLEFAAMEMTAPEKNLYRHKLEGYDPDWIETDWKQRTGTYTNLPAGDYTFRVRASNKHGVWSDQERTLKVKILPPPWRTWWAYSAYSFFVAGLLVLARRTIVQRERLKASFRLEHMELEKAKEIDKIKTSFFTNISHEFRTPLTLIKGPVQDVLEKYRDDAVVQTKLKLVQRNSDLLLKLINQLLDLSRLEAGTLRIEKTDIDTFGFVRAVSSSFESLARQKDLNLEIKVPTWSEPAAVDRDKLETIIINLVNNAIKFTPSGGTVTVTCTLKECILTLEVADTGIGIPKDQQFRVFERFYQVSNTHKEVGTGIGLALAKELVTLMGGVIQLKSTPGEGSSFSVQLPVEPVANAHEVPLSYVDHKSQENGISSIQHRTGNDEVHSTKPAVLVVEDNNDLRHFIIDCLGDEFDFLQADNGKKGLETATDNIPDLIISDVMMPEMDGITMTGKLKADVRTSHIPLILLTAKSTEDSKLHGLSSGADDYLTKPFNKSELLLKVRNGITRQQKLREKLRADLISTAPKVNVLSADEKFLDKVKGCILARLGDEQLSVESLAEEIGLSRVQLYRKVIALTGLSVNELIRKLRLQRASQLLKQKWGPVSQVAYEVGFSNLSYFSKVFKEEFGALPSEFSVEKMD